MSMSAAPGLSLTIGTSSSSGTKLGRRSAFPLGPANVDGPTKRYSWSSRGSCAWPLCPVSSAVCACILLNGGNFSGTTVGVSSAVDHLESAVAESLLCSVDSIGGGRYVFSLGPLAQCSAESSLIGSIASSICLLFDVSCPAPCLDRSISLCTPSAAKAPSIGHRLNVSRL